MRVGILAPMGLLRSLLLGVLFATPLACLELGASVAPSRSEQVVAGMRLECPVGSLGCPCTGGGGCDPGLICDAGICVSDYGEPMPEMDEEYRFADDLAPVRAAPMQEARGARLRNSRDGKAKFKRDAPAPAAETITMPSGGAEPSVVEPVDIPTEVEPAHAQDPAALRRQVIYTATLDVAVYDRDAAMLVAEELPERWGGWIESRWDYRVTLRIPADRLFDAITELSELGVVMGKTLRADDVTAEYVDLDARIKVLEQMVAHLELLLSRATSVEQALEIRVELDRVRLELESAKARMRALAEMIDFSTLTVDLRQRGPEHAAEPSNDPFPWVDTLGHEATAYR